MTRTPSFIVNNPVAGTTYRADQTLYEFISNAGTNITVTVEAWSGTNGTGSQVVRTLTAAIRDVTDGTDHNPQTGSGNTWTSSSSSLADGTSTFCAEGSYSGAALGSLVLYADYTGRQAGGGILINTGTPASPVWTAATMSINTGTPAAPNWVAAPIRVNTGTPAAPVWTLTTTPMT